MPLIYFLNYRAKPPSILFLLMLTSLLIPVTWNGLCAWLVRVALLLLTTAYAVGKLFANRKMRAWLASLNITSVSPATPAWSHSPWLWMMIILMALPLLW